MTGNVVCPKEESRSQKSGIINIGSIHTGILEEKGSTNFQMIFLKHAMVQFDKALYGKTALIWFDCTVHHFLL